MPTTDTVTPEITESLIAPLYAILGASDATLLDLAIEAVAVLAIGGISILVISRLVGWLISRGQDSDAAHGAGRSVLYMGVAIVAARFVYIFNPSDSLWRVTLLTVIGLPALMLVSRLVSNLVGKHHDDQTAMIARRGVFYIGLGILLVTVMQNLGFQVGALLGTAGIVGVAFGFASQTSLSNFISGLFLVSEKPFKIGDVIQVAATTGVVHSIDMLSVKLRTFDNRYVRIPNETMIKTEVTNITRFPIRRFDLTLGVAYKEDISRVIDILADVADKNPYVLDEPEPIILFTGFGDSALSILFGVWFANADFLAMRRSIMHELKERLDAEGIEIPFPHRSLYTGDATKPFPITLVNPSTAPTPFDSTATTSKGE